MCETFLTLPIIFIIYRISAASIINGTFRSNPIQVVVVVNLNVMLAVAASLGARFNYTSTHTIGTNCIVEATIGRNLFTKENKDKVT